MAAPRAPISHEIRCDRVLPPLKEPVAKNPKPAGCDCQKRRER